MPDCEAGTEAPRLEVCVEGVAAGKGFDRGGADVDKDGMGRSNREVGIIHRGLRRWYFPPDG